MSSIKHEHAGHTHATAVDPVCGMTVAVGSGEAPVVYEGVSYHFCCAGCRSRFEAEPARYAPASR